MSEEIKEILDNFEKYEARYRLRNETQFIITHREIQILSDYITNLQEENEQLKELCDKYEEEHKTTFEEWKKDINIIDELEKYLKKQMEYYKLDTDYYVEYKLTLDKLNELREDNK